MLCAGLPGAVAVAERDELPIAWIMKIGEALSILLNLEIAAGLEVEAGAGSLHNHSARQVEGARTCRTDDAAISLPFLPGSRSTIPEAGGGAVLASTDFKAIPRTISLVLPFIIFICGVVGMVSSKQYVLECDMRWEKACPRQLSLKNEQLA